MLDVAAARVGGNGAPCLFETFSCVHADLFEYCCKLIGFKFQVYWLNPEACQNKLPLSATLNIRGRMMQETPRRVVILQLPYSIPLFVYVEVIFHFFYIIYICRQLGSQEKVFGESKEVSK